MNKALFWSKVKKTDSCWLWQGSADRRGYGSVRIDHVTQKAHRVSWSLAHGFIPPDLCVLHRCDTPACVNPDHLFLGTRADNSADMIAKGRARHRSPNGEQNGASKLTAPDVVAIRASTISSRALAKQFGVSKVTIQNIRHGRTWKLVGDPAGKGCVKVERQVESGFDVVGFI